MTDGWAAGTAGGFISVGDDGPEGVVVRDHNIPGLWGRLTAEPRAGWYSWQTAVPKADGTFETMPAEQPHLYGTAHASDPAQDSLPARPANGEAGLAAGATTGRVVWLEFEAVTPGYRFAVGGGGGAKLEVVRLTADNDGTSGVWTAAYLQTHDANDQFIDTGTVYAVYPFPGHRLFSGDYWPVVYDTGDRQPAPPSPPPPPPPPGVPPPPTPAPEGSLRVRVHGGRKLAVAKCVDGVMQDDWGLYAPNLKEARGL